jgi:outer membrane lipoprotein SlyB
MSTSAIGRSRAAALVVMLAAGTLLAGCAAPRAGDVYRRGETLRAQDVQLGIIESTRWVQIEGRDTGVGTVGGAALGGIAGSQIGAGTGSVAAAIGGAILGGVIGNTVERDTGRRNGVEVTVRLDNGRMLAVVQEDAGEGFRPGDRVRVVSNGYATRVTR